MKVKKFFRIQVYSYDVPIRLVPENFSGKVTGLGIYSKLGGNGFVALKTGWADQYNELVTQGEGEAGKEKPVDVTSGDEFEYGLYAIADSNVQSFEVEVEIELGE